MKKILSFLFVVGVVLVLAPENTLAKVWVQQEFECGKTISDPTDSTRKMTDCTIYVNSDSAGETDGQSVSFVVKYNYETDKSDFEIIEDVSGITTNINKVDNTFDFDFNSGLGTSFTAFKIRFYSDASLSGYDCGGELGMDYNGVTSTGTTSKNVTSNNPDTGVSVPVIALGVGVIACLAVYASTSRKTKMHRI
ncbi:MAG: hypothetical protein IJA94_00855 [Bacilli bacterium]|nr:hypothetical protein [Bacilli bacterium]